MAYFLTLRYGVAQGARKIIDQEYEHAKTSVETGIYVIQVLNIIIIN